MAKGGAAAERIFGPVVGYEELTDEQVKILKEVRMEKEPGTEQETAGLGIEQGYSCRGRGSYHPYQQQNYYGGW